MDFNWIEYWDFAKGLLPQNSSDQKSECECRVGISRAYYACYHRVKTWIQTETGYAPTGGSVHKWAFDTLLDIANDYSRNDLEKSRQIKELRRKYKVLRKRRESADYEAYISNIHSTYGVAAYNEANFIMTILNQWESAS